MKKILIVEDNADVRRLLTITLDPGSREIHAASNLTDGLKLTSAVRPDLVLVDVMMPGGNGLDLCRHIKSDPELRHAFVVIVSARGQESDIAEGRSAGADAYLVKPFSPLHLLDLVEHPNEFQGYGLNE